MVALVSTNSKVPGSSITQSADTFGTERRVLRKTLLIFCVTLGERVTQTHGTRRHSRHDFILDEITIYLLSFVFLHFFIWTGNYIT